MRVLIRQITNKYFHLFFITLFQIYFSKCDKKKMKIFIRNLTSQNTHLHPLNTHANFQGLILSLETKIRVTRAAKITVVGG